MEVTVLCNCFTGIKGLNFRKVMYMSLTLGSRYTPDRHIPPDNQGVSWIAQKRLENIVGRAVERHKNALLVDANPIYLWIKQPLGQGGLTCTCQSKPKSTGIADLLDKRGLQDLGPLPVAEFEPNRKQTGILDFEVIHIRGDNGTHPNTLSNDKQKEFDIKQNNGNLEEQYGDTFSETESPMGKQSNGYDPNKIAKYLNSPNGKGLYGGDSTACAICYSTGRVHGYQLVNGNRVILDASGEYPYTLSNSNADFNKRPCVFTIRPEGYVEWTADLPFTVKRWLSFSIMNNDKPAAGLILEVFWNNTWQSLDAKWLISNNNVNKEGVKLRVRVDPKLSFNSEVKFTHADIRFMYGDPILAQCPQIDTQVDYDFNDALITTNFEVMASTDTFPRESYFQDSKYGFMWKANSVTASTTSLNQVFVYEVSVRRVLPQELFSSLNVIAPPNTSNLGHKGFTFIQGDIQRDNFPYTDIPMQTDIPNSYELGQTQGDEYNAQQVMEIEEEDANLW